MCLVDTAAQMRRWQVPKKTQAQCLSTQQFSASADLKWEPHAGGRSGCSAWAEELGWGWERQAGLGYLAKEKTDWRNSLINVIDLHPEVIQPDQLASFEDVCTGLYSVGSHRLVIAGLEEHGVISRIWWIRHWLHFFVVWSRCFLPQRSTNKTPLKGFLGRKWFIYLFLQQVSLEGFDFCFFAWPVLIGRTSPADDFLFSWGLSRSSLFKINKNIKCIPRLC